MLASWRPDNEESALEVLNKAVNAHSLAGKVAHRRYRPMTALDLLNELPQAIR